MQRENLIPVSANDVTETWLQSVLEKANPDTNVEVSSLTQVTEVNGIMGGVFKACVKIKDDVKKIFIKIGVSKDNPFYGFTVKSNVDNREVKAYRDDLSALVAFERDHLGKSDLEQCLPKIYASDFDDSEDHRGIYIVMEDLSVNHDMVNYLEGLNKGQLVSALEAIARLHAVSHCYCKSKGQPFDPALRSIIPLLVDGQDLLDAYSDFKDLAIDNFGKTERGKRMIPYIRNMFKDFKSFFLTTMDLVDDRFLIHGDFWSNNIMFNKSDNSMVKIFDWAAFSSGPPYFDFCLLAFTSMDPATTESTMLELFEAYYAKFLDTLKQFDVEQPFTKDQFIKDCFMKGYITTFNYLMAAYDPLWSKPELNDKMIWILENAVKHRPDLFNQ